MKLQMAGDTHMGAVRDHNEDAVGVDSDLPAAVLADGMGGLARGEVASDTVVNCVLAALRDGDDPERALQKAHQQILAEAAGATERMGATAVVVTSAAGKLHTHWVGDSRAYLLRNRVLQAVTRDHSLVQGLVDAGAITESEAESHPNRNVVTRAVGIQENAGLEIDHVALDVRRGDRLLICSDGLHGYLPEKRILALLLEHSDDKKAVDALIAATLSETEAGDNISVICLTIC